MNTRICAICKGILDEGGWSEEEAAAVARKFSIPKEMCVLICEDCWEEHNLDDAKLLN